MARPPVFSVEDKFRLVLSVSSGELTIVEAARRGKASEQSICEAHVELRVWKRSAGPYEDLEVIRLEERMPTARFTRLLGCRSARIGAGSSLSGRVARRRGRGSGA